MNSTFTFTYTCTRTNTFTNTITNTYTHTNLPLRKASMDKALRQGFDKKRIRNSDASVDFNHICYPPTLPRQERSAGGETPYFKEARKIRFFIICQREVRVFELLGHNKNFNPFFIWISLALPVLFCDFCVYLFSTFRKHTYRNSINKYKCLQKCWYLISTVDAIQFVNQVLCNAYIMRPLFYSRFSFLYLKCCN